METELKLKFRPADSQRLRAHPLLAAHSTGAPAAQEHSDIYYDTPEHDLWHHGLTLRVRAADGEFTQTVKTADGSSPALHRRGEWECHLPDQQIRPALLARQIKPIKLAALLSSPALIDRLTPIFSGTTQRTTWQLRLSGGEKVVCAVDVGEFHGGVRNAKISELELELKDGAPARLFDFALALHREVPLELANDSKAARGFALLGSPGPVAVKARSVRLKKKAALNEAFNMIGLNCLEQMEANVSGVLAKDAESLHQMRIGLRRLRALLNMFEPLVVAPQDIQEGLDWLAAELGATRDWDVLAGSTLKRVCGFDTSALHDAARANAAKLHGVMLQVLHSPRFTELMLRLNGWLQGTQWQDDITADARKVMGKRTARSAIPLLQKAEKRLRKRIAALEPHDTPALHRVRIAAKKARYAAESFRDILDKEEAAQYIDGLSALQDRLGLLNDMAVAALLLPELQQANEQLVQPAMFARGYVSAETKANLRQLGRPLRKIAKLRMT
ncbi:MAG: CHAD domain-containing protein [Burkholderiaceae bacterium]|nr:CHAD domain-containing protein [Burkholderiaceae bacterium]